MIWRSPRKQCEGFSCVSVPNSTLVRSTVKCSYRIMRAALGIFLGFLFTVAALGQGMVQFNNNGASQLMTNNPLGPTRLGFTIGLYVAPQGTTDPNAFTLMGPTTASQTGLGTGLFNGNPLPNNFVISNNTGQTIAFQVRAWSTFAGATYEAALGRVDLPTRLLGSSTIGEVTPALGITPVPALFGTGPGQVGGFVIGVPEPSTTLLAVIGAAVGLSILRSPSRRRQNRSQ